MKLLTCSVGQTLELIVGPEREALVAQLTSLGDQEQSEHCFIEQALEELKVDTQSHTHTLHYYLNAISLYRLVSRLLSSLKKRIILFQVCSLSLPPIFTHFTLNLLPDEVEKSASELAPQQCVALSERFVEGDSGPAFSDLEDSSSNTSEDNLPSVPLGTR